MPDVVAFRRRLLRWYDQNARKLPWREGKSPWRILVSEVMLQQTRVEAVLPFYQRFLARFPDAESFAAAAEPDVLHVWSGLGYYSRARNLQRAAQAIAARGFPDSHDGIRALPGVGPYTAAAVASIGFELPHAAIDGNVLRVLARFTAEPGDIAAGVTRQRIAAVAGELLDGARPGDFNQAMMELGATVCVPRNPRCLVCPVARDCAARQQGRQHEFPVKRRKAAANAVECAVVVVRRAGQLLLRQRRADAARMPGFWEFPAPEDLAELSSSREEGSFLHTIVNTRYAVRVLSGELGTAPPPEMHWFSEAELSGIPLTTMTKKALSVARHPSKTSGTTSAFF